MMDRFKHAFEIKGDGLDGMKSWIGVFLIALSYGIAFLGDMMPVFPDAPVQDYIDHLDTGVGWLTMLLDWLGGGFFALGAWGKIKKFFSKDAAWVKKLLGM